MKFRIQQAEMHQDTESGFAGKTVFTVDNHKQPYEINFFSKRGKEWDYSLHFSDEPGNEDEMNSVDAFIEEDDEAFDMLLDAALESAH